MKVSKVPKTPKAKKKASKATKTVNFTVPLQGIPKSHGNCLLCGIKLEHPFYTNWGVKDMRTGRIVAHIERMCEACGDTIVRLMMPNE